MREDQRRRLLYPDWADQPGERYDELSAVDRAVWDRTRGITRGEAATQAWHRRLAEHVALGTITSAEAIAATIRAEKRSARP
jgi:hypothetical protein